MKTGGVNTTEWDYWLSYIMKTNRGLSTVYGSCKALVPDFCFNARLMLLPGYVLFTWLATVGGNEYGTQMMLRIPEEHRHKLDRRYPSARTLEQDLVGFLKQALETLTLLCLEQGANILTVPIVESDGKG